MKTQTLDFHPLAGILQSNGNEWHTPREITTAARRVLGGIDLDPASCEQANATVQAARFFSAEDDGLSRPWSGRVFLNPPYGVIGGRSSAGIWAQRLIDEYDFGDVTAAILLVNAATGDRWFAPLWRFPICFPRRRVRFISPDGEQAQPTHSNAIVYLGGEHDSFAIEFAAIGVVAKALQMPRRSLFVVEG